MDVTIYCLRDPRDGTVKYVGQTTNPERRQSDHELNRFQHNCAKSRWGSELQEAGLKPVFECLEICDFAVANKRELHWVTLMASQGHNLLNRPVGSIPRDALASIIDLESAYERLTNIRDELTSTVNEISPVCRKSAKEIIAILKAVKHVDSARFAIENRLYERKKRVFQASGAR